MTAPAIVKRQRDSEKYTFLEITIKEGRNRQVRRMLEAIGATVLKLVRVRIGPLTLAGLQMGKWRELEADEVIKLRKVTRAKERS
jgi:pseudouridine synthase